MSKIDSTPKRVSGKLAGAVAALIVAVVVGFGAGGAGSSGADTASSANAGNASAAATATTQQTAQTNYKFRSNKYLKEHYEKHGKQMGYQSREDYVAGANAVISNPESLHKLEKEDGDDVYYLQATDEIVIVSTDGYIRTYFNPGGIDYFNRQ